MRFSPILSALLTVAWVAGCVTANPHDLTTTDIRQLGLADVQVQVPPNVRLSWPEEEEAAMREKYGARPEQRTPEDNAAARARATRTLSERIRSALMAEVGRDLSGSRKVRAIVTVKTFSIPTLGERILINDQAQFDAEVALVDARTNAPVMTYSGGLVNIKLVGGILAPVADATGASGSDRSRQLVFEYTDRFKKWLLKA
jgi:hypothetical protein